MHQLRTIVFKEFLLLSRDIHGLLLLFIMPIVFILIMSLAMQDDFSNRAGGKIEILLKDRSQGLLSDRMMELMEKNNVFVLKPQLLAEDVLRKSINQDQYKFLLVIDEHFENRLLSNIDEKTLKNEDNENASVKIIVAPSTSRQTEMIFQSIVNESIARLRLENMLSEMQGNIPDFDTSEITKQLTGNNLVSIIYGSDHKNKSSDKYTPPSSVQQSVPAWLVFSLFFVVVPLSNTFINERRLGTLKRIKTINVNPLSIVFGKLIPYFFINQVQVFLMLLVGVYLVPIFGGERLTLGDSMVGLSLMGIAISCGSLGYAMLIAVIARTSEQATTLGGTGNIILAAIGGIMVPTFIMPDVMQSLSTLSPMSWGLQGFLDILLRGGSVEDVIPEALTLILFGVICLALSALVFKQNDAYLQY